VVTAIQVLRDIFEADIDPELLDFAAGADGDPSLLAELALGLAEEGLVKEKKGTVRLIGRRVPRRVLAVVKRRLEGLSSNSRQFVKVAAVLGRSFRLEDASRMLGRSSAAMLGALDEAMSAGFVVAAENSFAFPSDFLWQGVIECIPAPARSTLRREAIDHSGPGGQAGDQHNGVTARPIWVTERAAEPAGPAGGGTGGVYSTAHGLIMNGQAVAGIRAAEEVLGDPNAPAAARLDAEASMLLSYYLLDRQEAVRHSERILRERVAGPGDIAALMALTTLSNTRWRRGELTEALSLGRAAVRYSENVDPAWRLHFQLALAGKLANLREFDKAASLINAAEAGLRGLPTRVWAAAPATMRARLLLQSGQFSRARREAEVAIAATGRDAVPMLRPLAHSVLSAACLHMADLPTAAEHLRLAQSELAELSVLCSAQYAWTEFCITAEREGRLSALEMLSGRHRHLPVQRSLYIEDPGAAAFLVRLALDVGDDELKHSVLETVDGLAEDNPGISIIGLGATHAKALANSDVAALERIIAQSPDPLSVTLASAELAKHRDTAETAAVQEGHPHTIGPPNNAAHEGCPFSDVERQIAYLVSVGWTNREIGKAVHLSEHTVNYHLRKVYKRLGISTRAELAVKAADLTHGHRQ
jgi:DNA-binding CsgD family transcriptional regulator